MHPSLTMRNARVLAMGLAVLALAMLLVSGPGARAGWWPWTVGLGIYRWAAYVGIAAALVSLVLLALLAVPRWRARPWVPLLALCIALAAVAPPMILLSRAKALPRIHDITTDFADPPAFVALLETRRKAPNGADYGGEPVAAEQRRAYGDIQAVLLKLPPREAHQKALDAARNLGWEVVASDAAAGRIEATDTTRFFGFKDDVVIRVRAEGEGSRIDVRSVSRVGLSDIGANAARVRRFLDEVA